MRQGIDCHQVEWIERKLTQKNSPDYTNQTFGKLTALFPVRKAKNTKETGWLCKCGCGNELFVPTDKLTTGNTRSCSCLLGQITKQRWAQYRDNIIGEKINHLKVISYKGLNNRNVALYEFHCDCGNNIIRTYRSVKGNNSMDCGCGQKQRTQDYINSFIGKRFGHLVVLRYIETVRSGIYNLECQCDCGNITISNNDTLRKGAKISCGCIRSEGEQQIESILKKEEIPFTREYSFSDLISPLGGVMRYDFALLDENNNPVRLIEFDGPQHQQPESFFGGEEKFQKVQANDKLKNEYALSRNIPLIRIPYNEKNKITLSLLLSDKYLITDKKE